MKHAYIPGWTGEVAARDIAPRDALRELLAAPRLKFGAADQIECIYILRLAERLLDPAAAIQRVCPECGGEGEIEKSRPGRCDCCGRECSYCSSSTIDVECKKCDGEGSIPYDRDTVYNFFASTISEILEKYDSQGERAA